MTAVSLASYSVTRTARSSQPSPSTSPTMSAKTPKSPFGTSPRILANVSSVSESAAAPELIFDAQGERTSRRSSGSNGAPVSAATTHDAAPRSPRRRRDACMTNPPWRQARNVRVPHLLQRSVAGSAGKKANPPLLPRRALMANSKLRDEVPQRVRSQRFPHPRKVALVEVGDLLLPETARQEHHLLHAVGKALRDLLVELDPRAT